MRNAYLAALYDLAKEDERIFALVADNGAIVYDKYRKAFPERFINVGIAEATMISTAAGLASCGKIPFTYTIANFIAMRAYEQVRNDVCLQRMNVKLVGIGVGFVYSNLGPTHHTIEDMALMGGLPHMTVFSPCDPLEAKKVTYAAAKIDGPVYIRLATGGTPSIYTEDYEFEVGKGIVLREGKDITVISSGNIMHEVLKAVDELIASGDSVRLINIPTLKPFDKDIVIQAVEETERILVVEEHLLLGGLGSCVASAILESGAQPKEFRRKGLEDSFPKGYGSYEDMKAMNKLSKDDIVKEAKGMLR